MKRILEPEVMDNSEQAEAYAEADFTDSNSIFVKGLLNRLPNNPEYLIDIGCGPANIPVMIAEICPSLIITAVDASVEMVKIATQNVLKAGYEKRITIRQERLPGLSLDLKKIDAIISKDLLHHLPDPSLFWDEIKSIGNKDTLLYIMDLIRPVSLEEAENIVAIVSGNEPEILKRDFYNSLLAAFSIEEINDQLKNAGLSMTANRVSERHMLVCGTL